jgi:serine/threonine protein phosphatase PrpC
VLSDQELGVYILCDGMGGTASGDVAASRAAQTTLNYLRQHAATIQKVSSGHASPDKLIALAQSAVQEANSAIHSHTIEHAELRGSGTTIVLLITAGDNGVCAHVGDSRLYAFRNNQLLQLTKDHSLAQDLIDRGVLERNQLHSFPFKHVLSRAVGLLPAVSVDTLLFEILPGDRFLLSSDGISGKVASTALEGVMSHGDSPRLLEKIVSLARESDGDDDLSAVLVEASADDHEREIQMVRSAELVLKTSVLQEVFLFQALDPQHILRIVNASKVVDCSKGTTVVRQGEPEVSLYIVLDGNFAVEINEQPIAQISRGNHFGEMALLTSQPRSATVCATTQGKVLEISAEEFRKFVQSHPQDGIQMITALAKELSERLRQTNQFLSQRT